MKNKKAQVTIFIIIAIIIIGAVALFFTLRETLQKEVYTPEVAPIANFVEECIENTAGDVIYTIGQGGGYYFPPTFSTDSGITYYLINNKSYMPSKKQIEGEISYYVNERLFFCTKNFVDFSEYEITQGEIKTSSKIYENRVILNVEYPLTIKKGESRSRIKDFEVEIPVRLGVVYDSVSGFIAEGIEDGICLSCLLNISETHDLYVDMFDYDNETVIFIFKDENLKLNDVDFEFIFANEY